MHHPVPYSPQPLGQPATPRAELAPFLTPNLMTVVTGARRRALRDGDRQIDTAHLLHALVESDPESRAVEVLRRAGVDPVALNSRIAARISAATAGREERHVPWGEGEPSQQV